MSARWSCLQEAAEFLGVCPQTLSVREWTCPDCGSIHDRDVNAAINLKKWPRVRLAAASPFSDKLIAR
ncbi:zinc ribbon domain-containing protein [Thermochromatium tepidum]|uniref:zinc ribbon domain-containing protein n=1 Tax=Thermochromatium tepidum TaxID=1050 RepID=UPI003CCD7B0A